MLLPLKLVCKSSKIRRDGTSLIFIQYCYNSDKRTLLSTEIAIPPAYWKRSRITANLPKDYGNHEELNKRLKTLLRLVEDVISHALQEKIIDVLTFVKSTFKPDLNPENLAPKAQETANKQPETNLDFYFQIDDYIKCKTNKVTPGMLRVYKNMKDHLLAFQDYRKVTITFNCLDFNFYEGLVDFLTFEYIQRRRKTVIKGLRTATVGKTIKQLRIFIRDRVRRKIIPPIDLSDFKILNEESDAIYLSWKEINQIYNTDLTDYPSLLPYRDLFVLGCLTGLRFSDFSNIKPEDIRKGMLHKKQEKSDHWVVIPLMDAANEILINRFKKVIPIVNNPDFNVNIKEIGRLSGVSEAIKFSYKKGNKDIEVIKPKYGWITSHTCRRSFCTNEFLAGTPVELIMKISGHKSLQDFYRYIRITPEEAGRKIKEIWAKRDKKEIEIIEFR
ncbi:phage integrase SAM-like domain-containing protein [Chitinophaga ginsengisegetis]|uniref:tyrosine-type recombinase/integrase n=1 Tax=Chitinophaga ginsengisegetis TaxID=393003 RepID=UPI00342CEB58